MALIQKSVRLDEKLLAYIDCQPGKTFTDKLTGILEMYFNDDGAYKDLMSQVTQLEDENTRLATKLYLCRTDIRTAIGLLNTLVEP